MNRIIPNPDLANVDYTDLLNKILQVLQEQQIFEIHHNNQWLLINSNQIATQITQLQVNNPLGNATAVDTATLNLSAGSEERFCQQIRQITNAIQTQLKAAILKKTGIDRFIFIKQLISDLKKFRVISHKFDLTYNFPPAENLEKQRLTFKKDCEQNRQLLKAHKIKISVNKPRDFHRELVKGINNFIDRQFGDTSYEDKEEIAYILHQQEEDINSDIYRLQNLVNKETLGKLKRLAKINYLEFLFENITENASSEHLWGKIYLADLIRRLKLLDDYINNPNKADGEYLVNYQGIEVNYQNVFSHSEAFDMLPIIPVIEGYLGETEDQNCEKVEFVFGIKLKFDGRVQADGGRTVFDYNLNILNPDSREHKEGIKDESKKLKFVYKVLKIAFLYYFLFASRENPEEPNYHPQNELHYNPIAKFEQDILPILQHGTDEEKKNIFGRCIKGFDKFKVQKKINILKEVLKKLIKRKTPFPTREYPLHISVKNSILEQDIDTINSRSTLFKPGLQDNHKDCLKYINLGEASTDTNVIVSLQAQMTISEIHFLETDDREKCDMKYDIEQDISVLPVVFLPINNRQCDKFYQKNFSERKLVIFPYCSETEKLESHQEFIYKITYSLLAYICLYVLLEKQSKLFIPVLRLHLKEKTDDEPIEKFIASLTGVLSHLLNEKHRSNSQGIYISDLDAKGKYKKPNTLSSLYSVLPKKFTLKDPDKFQFSELDKLAIIVVSSRVSDSKWGTQTKKSNLMGEIIDFQIQNQTPQTVKLRLLKTFSENYDDHQKMFEYPSVIVDNVDKLYKKGYKHFIYIAKVPYSSTLHITQTENDGLYFMSGSVIKALKTEREHIKIYPMFFDKYYAVKVGEEIKSTSLYIQDTMELTELAEDSNKQSVIFFNLFNGMVVAKDTNYNGVMSYATLLNIYKGILDDDDIRRGLISNQSNLKSEILQCLTLFHFYRYEKYNVLQLKLDPYENLIGDESIGKLALFNHTRGKAKFNSLAFLTYIRDILETPE